MPKGVPSTKQGKLDQQARGHALAAGRRDIMPKGVPSTKQGKLDQQARGHALAAVAKHDRDGNIAKKEKAFF